MEFVCASTNSTLKLCAIPSGAGGGRGGADDPITVKSRGANKPQSTVLKTWKPSLEFTDSFYSSHQSWTSTEWGKTFIEQSEDRLLGETLGLVALTSHSSSTHSQAEKEGSTSNTLYTPKTWTKNSNFNTFVSAHQWNTDISKISNTDESDLLSKPFEGSILFYHNLSFRYETENNTSANSKSKPSVKLATDVKVRPLLALSLPAHRTVGLAHIPFNLSSNTSLFSNKTQLYV